MYQYSKKIDSILYYEFHKNDLIAIIGNSEESYLTRLNDDLILIDKVKQTTAYDFVIYKNNIYITKSTAYESCQIILKDEFKDIRELPFGMNIKGSKFKNKYICSGLNNNTKHFLLIDLETGNLIREIPINLGFGNVYDYLEENLIISTIRNDGFLGAFTLDNQKLWEHDINNILISEKRGEIREIKVYKTDIIVASTAGIISIEIASGKINWASVTYAETIEIIENIGYVCTSLSLFKINLDTGVIIDYDAWEFSRLPNFDFEGKTYWPAGHRVIYYEGLLWYAVYDSGESFVIAINPQDGYYEWIHNVETNEKIKSIKFHDNRMYILDYGDELHAYEKNPD